MRELEKIMKLCFSATRFLVLFTLGCCFGSHADAQKHDENTLDLDLLESRYYDAVIHFEDIKTKLSRVDTYKKMLDSDRPHTKEGTIDLSGNFHPFPENYVAIKELVFLAPFDKDLRKYLCARKLNYKGVKTQSAALLELTRYYNMVANSINVNIDAKSQFVESWFRLSLEATQSEHEDIRLSGLFCADRLLVYSDLKPEYQVELVNFICEKSLADQSERIVKMGLWVLYQRVADQDNDALGLMSLSKQIDFSGKVHFLQRDNVLHPSRKNLESLRKAKETLSHSKTTSNFTVEQLTKLVEIVDKKILKNEEKPPADIFGEEVPADNAKNDKVPNIPAGNAPK